MDVKAILKTTLHAGRKNYDNKYKLWSLNICKKSVHYEKLYYKMGKLINHKTPSDFQSLEEMKAPVYHPNDYDFPLITINW